MESLRSLKSAFKSAIGRPSPSPERDATGRVVRRRAERAKSPPLPTTEELQRQYDERNAEIARLKAEEAILRQMLEQREASRFLRDEEVNMIIGNLNQYLFDFFGEGVDVDIQDPNIRFIIGMIVTSNRVRQSVSRKLIRSKALLTAVASVIINKAKAGAGNLKNQIRVMLPYIRRGLEATGRGLGATGRFLVQRGHESGRAALGAISSVASSAASRAMGYFSSQPALVMEQREQRASSPPRGNEQSFQQSMLSMASAAYDSITTGLPIFYEILSRVLVEVYDLLAPCVAAGVRMTASVAVAGVEGVTGAYGAICRYLRPQQALSQAVNHAIPPLPPLLQEQDLECAICMTAANFIDERGVNYGPLGYIERHRNGAPGHPDRFHQSCLQGCHDRCPMCRQEGPVWGMQRPPGQGGGGLKKYRSKSRSRSRSKSKTRRLRKSRSKACKSYKSRKPRSSSRRK
jgi:hypothetical protein